MAALTSAVLRGIPKSGPTDPIEYYRRPIVGRLFRERINIGLRLLPERTFGSALEIGYGAGALLLVMAPSVRDLHGIDLDADPLAVGSLLSARGQRATLARGSVYELPYGAGAFDLVYSFSVFEHLHEYERALAEVCRVLRPGGLFLLGMPSVNKTMELGFSLIGFKGIEDHHVTTPSDVNAALGSAGFSAQRYASLNFPAPPPFGVRLYHCWLMEKTK
jgi:SAM-dependent methyltransferase